MNQKLSSILEIEAIIIHKQSKLINELIKENEKLNKMPRIVEIIDIPSLVSDISSDEEEEEKKEEPLYVLDKLKKNEVDYRNTSKNSIYGIFRRIARENFGEEHLSFIIKKVSENPNVIIEWLKKDELKSSALNIVRNIVEVLKVNNLESYKEFNVCKKLLISKKGYAQKDKKRPPNKEGKDITWNDILKYQKDLEDIEKNEKRNKTKVEFRMYLILSFIILLCPARNEWFFNLSWDKSHKNYIDLKNKKLHYTYFKTSDSLGKISYDINDKLVSILQLWKKLFEPNTTLLFGQLKRPSQTITNWMTRDKCNIGIGLSGIRNLWIADVLPSLDYPLKEKYAKMMQHSVQTQAIVYGFEKKENKK